jgi:hypothetical protein
VQFVHIVIKYPLTLHCVVQEYPFILCYIVTERPKGDVIGKEERTSSDKKRERRHKKLRQRERQHEREKREQAIEKLRPGLGNKYSKEKAMRDMEKVTKSSNITQVHLALQTVVVLCLTKVIFDCCARTSSSTSAKYSISRNCLSVLSTS